MRSRKRKRNYSSTMITLSKIIYLFSLQISFLFKFTHISLSFIQTKLENVFYMILKLFNVLKPKNNFVLFAQWSFCLNRCQKLVRSWSKLDTYKRNKNAQGTSFSNPQDSPSVLKISTEKLTVTRVRHHKLASYEAVSISSAWETKSLARHDPVIAAVISRRRSVAGISCCFSLSLASALPADFPRSSHRAAPSGSLRIH